MAHAEKSFKCHCWNFSFTCHAPLSHDPNHQHYLMNPAMKFSLQPPPLPFHPKVLCLICKMKFTLKPYSPFLSLWDMFLFIIVKKTKFHQKWHFSVTLALHRKVTWMTLLEFLSLVPCTPESWSHSSSLSDESGNELSSSMSSVWYVKLNLH